MSYAMSRSKPGQGTSGYWQCPFCGANNENSRPICKKCKS